jgi:hypothetical protein
VWEGWTVQDFIDELEPTFDSIMQGKSYTKPPKDDKELKNWLMDNQPYYKKHIPDVFKYFKNKMSSKINEGKFKKDDLVYNTKTKTVGIVRIGDDKYGEVKTDADGNVNVDDLEKYNPIKNKHQKDAKAAPSTKKEVNSRGLFNPFKNE